MGLSVSGWCGLDILLGEVSPSEGAKRVTSGAGKPVGPSEAGRGRRGSKSEWCSTQAWRNIFPRPCVAPSPRVLKCCFHDGLHGPPAAIAAGCSCLCPARLCLT